MKRADLTDWKKGSVKRSPKMMLPNANYGVFLAFETELASGNQR